MAAACARPYVDPDERKKVRPPGDDNRRRPWRRPVLAPTPDHRAGCVRTARPV